MTTNNWREYVYIPQKERWIIIAIIVLINSIICIRYLFQPIESDTVIVNHLPDKKKEELSIQGLSSSSEDSIQFFQVNKASYEDWLALGFTSKQTNMILSYKSKFGTFKREADLLKVYCIDEKFTKRKDLKLIFDMGQNNLLSNNSSSVKVGKNEINQIQLVSVNKASREELIQLRGIGQKLSTRIIKYRDLLGGYVSKRQLLEVYGLSMENYNRFKEAIIVEGTPDKININTSDFKLLIRHPYLEKSHVNSILNYRKSHGTFENIYELKKIYSISDSIFAKIEPYLKIDD